MKEVLKYFFGGHVYGDLRQYKAAILFLILGYLPFVLFFLYVIAL